MNEFILKNNSQFLNQRNQSNPIRDLQLRAQRQHEPRALLPHRPILHSLRRHHHELLRPLEDGQDVVQLLETVEVRNILFVRNVI